MKKPYISKPQDANWRWAIDRLHNISSVGDLTHSAVNTGVTTRLSEQIQCPNCADVVPNGNYCISCRIKLH